MKQGESTNKTKDTQLKRAAETINRLKAQVTEIQQQSKSNAGADNDERSKVEQAEVRIKLLERQRADLIAAFRKQLKLIDLLKRQKVRFNTHLFLFHNSYSFDVYCTVCTLTADPLGGHAAAGVHRGGVPQDAGLDCLI